MKRSFQTLHLTTFLVLAAMLMPFTTATGQEEGEGGWVWSRYFLGEGQGVVLEASSVYVGGRNSEDAYLIKYDTDGQQLWTRNLRDIAGQFKVAMNASTLYAIGRTSDSFRADLILQAFDTEGRALWNHQFETEWGEEPFGVAADESGVYVVGSIFERVTSHPAGLSFFVRKYDKDGHEMWTRKLGSPTADGVSGVALNASDVYVVGKVAKERAVWKFDLDGRYAWARQFEIGGGEGLPSVAADATGVYIVGTTTGALPNQTSTGGDDAYVRKYSSDGDELWTRQFGAPGIFGTPAVDSAEAVAVTEHGVYVSGTTIVPGTLGGNDAFIRKFNSSGADLWGLRYRGSTGARDIAVGDTGIYLTGSEADRGEHGTGFLGRFGETPGPPRAPQASPGEAHVRLEWTSPHFDGGVPLTGYRIYRGSDPTSLDLRSMVEGATTLTYLDTEVANHVTYFYAVSALNEIGEGVRSPIVATAPGTPPAVANPGPPPPDFIFFGLLAVLGAALILAMYRLRGTRSPGREPVEGQVAHKPEY